jgi:serine/threonine protein kinase
METSKNSSIIVPKGPFFSYLKDHAEKSKINIKESQENKNSSSKNKAIEYDKKNTELKEMNEFLKEYCKDFLEKFELLETIKSGSAGAVFKGQLRQNDKQHNKKPIALKFLHNNNTKDKHEKNNNNHQEIQIHGILKYKHIPAIYGYYKIKDSSCIAMEFTKYGDIENFKRKILKKSSLSESLVLYIAGGIIEALYYLHAKNKIIHMDIKQQNVLIDDFLTVKLTDFSVSINYKSEKKNITLPMAGTCYYMAPEVLGKKTILVSEASKIDVYSLGVLLYLLAFCDYPYNLNDVDSKNYPQILKNIQENDLKFPEDTGHSRVFCDFLKNCLNKDIKKRYNIYQVMNDPWFKGYQIILNEKEKLYNAGHFIIDLMVDNFKSFNEYIKKLDN